MMVDKSKFRSDIKSLVKADKLREALDMLELVDNQNDDVIVLSGRLSRIENEYDQGFVAFEVLSRERNLIAATIMKFSGRISS